jgi:hypothetical protein
MINESRIKEDNIIRIGKKPIGNYCESAFRKLVAGIYDKYECLKIQFTPNRWHDTYYLIMLLWHSGTYIVKGSLKWVEDEVRMGEGILIENLMEITLVKHGSIKMRENETSEYANDVKAEFNKILSKQ